MPDFRVALSLNENEALALVNVIEPRLLDLADGMGELFDGEKDALEALRSRLRRRLDHAPKQPIDTPIVFARVREISERFR